MPAAAAVAAAAVARDCLRLLEVQVGFHHCCVVSGLSGRVDHVACAVAAVVLLVVHVHVRS